MGLEHGVVATSGPRFPEDTHVQNARVQVEAFLEKTGYTFSPYFASIVETVIAATIVLLLRQSVASTAHSSSEVEATPISTLGRLGKVVSVWQEKRHIHAAIRNLEAEVDNTGRRLGSRNKGENPKDFRERVFGYAGNIVDEMQKEL